MPVTPTNLKITPTVEGLDLSWSASSTEGLAGWLIHLRPKAAPVVPWTTEQLPAAARSYSATGLQVESYEVQVRGLTTGGLAQGVGTPEPKHVEPPPPPAPDGALTVALDMGGWGGSVFSKLKAAGITHARFSKTDFVEEARKLGVEPATVIFGTGGTIGKINPQSYAAEVLKAVVDYRLTAVEVLNEPGGSWFWSDPTNYTAYTALLKATHEALAGTGCKVLASYDGGQGGSVSFGRGVKAAGGLAYCDGVTMHPYGGRSGHGKNSSGEGWREGIELAHAETGLKVYVTEVGFPTHEATGDSALWTEAQQATNILSLGEFCLANTDKVAMLVIYNGVDTGPCYGVFKSNLAPKPGLASLSAIAAHGS
jgi:hypothetical protein